MSIVAEQQEALSSTTEKQSRAEGNLRTEWLHKM